MFALARVSQLAGGIGITGTDLESFFQRADFTEKINAKPRDYIGQTTLSLSRHPSFVSDDELYGCHIDLRPYTLLSAWASVVPGVRSTDFTPEEGGHPIYGADNLPDPWSNPQIQRVQAAFNPVAAADLPYWSASGASDANGTFPLPQAVPSYARNTPVTRTITVFNDDLTNTAVAVTFI